MVKNILIATLGESSIVVTSMVKALQAERQMTIDQLHVIHPQGEKLIDLGYELIKEHFEGKFDVIQCTLPFPDTNSREASMKFLQILSDLIQEHENVGDNVYLSLAGGRKNMSALMAVTCQFFECVSGLYHILDKHEDNPSKRNFHSIEALFDFNGDERFEKLSPPAEDLILVEIPYEQLSSGVDLRQYFSKVQSNPNVPPTIEIDGELEAFGHEIFQKKKTDLLDVHLSEEAYEFYKTNKGETSKRLKNCFRSMRNPQTLVRHIHKFSNDNSKTDCTCFKMGNTDERLFYYQTDSKIVIATIVQHDSEYKRIIDGNKLVYIKNHPPVIHSNELEQNNILIAPLGKSPMVVTQTFALLSTREGADIGKVIVIYPNNSEIRNGARLLQKVFKAKGKNCVIKPIKSIKDVASDDDCRIYREELVSVITEAQGANPDKSIYLSLSGGRKGMTALTFFAAQQANIDAVYHTLITDVDLEKEIEEETTVTALQKLTPQTKTQRLFLKSYDEAQFDLFRVPVIPLSLAPAETS